MNIVVLFIPFILIVFTSYRFNSEKLDEVPQKILIISVLEGIFGFSLIMLLFLVGFLNTFLGWFIFFLLFIVAGYIGFTIQKDLDSDLDWQIETVKNGIIIFLRTVFPLFVFLSIFRFYPWFFQVLLSVGATLVFNMISLPFQKLFYNFWVKLIKYVQTTYLVKYVWLWVFLIIFGLSSLVFSLPKDEISRVFNLSDDAPYIHFDRFPTNLKNEYKAVDLLNIKVPNHLEAQIIDYYFINHHLYLYTTNDRLHIYDVLNQEWVEHILSNDFIQKSALRKELSHLFFESDDSLYLLGQSGIYLMIDSKLDSISHFKLGHTQWFIMDEKIHFVTKESDKVYEIYMLENQQLIRKKSISLIGTSYVGLKTVGDTLFYQSNNRLIRYDQTQESYVIYPGVPAYDSKNKLMYYARNINYSDLITKDTTYHQVDAKGNVKSMSFIRIFNMVGMVVDGTYYLTVPESDKLERIEIMNKDFNFIAIHKPVNHTPFWINNNWTKVYLGNVRDQNGQLEYLQVEQNNQTLLLTLRVLEKQNIALSLPFYSHYSLWVFIPLLLGIIIPITNDREYVTIISFENMTRKKD